MLNNKQSTRQQVTKKQPSANAVKTIRSTAVLNKTTSSRRMLQTWNIYSWSQDDIVTLLVTCVYICLHVYILQNQSNEARIRELEDLLRKEKEARSIERDTLTTEIDRLRKAVDDQLMEYRDLMDMKIQLDAEISAYRKLLESEETR